MTDWYTRLAAPIEAVAHGVEQVPTFETTYVGPTTFSNMRYPVAEVLPDDTTRTGPTDWTHTIVCNLYFERSRDTDYLGDVLHPVAAVLDEALAALSTVECITNYHPASIQDFAGELDDTKLLLVSIQFEATTQLNPGEF